MTDHVFDLSALHKNFESSLVGETDVTLQEYLDGYEEINKFFYLMGSIFSFVSSDLKEKMDILAVFLSDNGSNENFKSVETMLKYELDNKLFEKSDYVSGSRTLLRLHRGLDFIRTFLKGLGDLENEENTHHCCRVAYDGTLAKYHSFFIRNGAKLAMIALPTRGNLLQKVCCGDHEKIKHSLAVLPSTLATTADVYSRIENLYTKYDLHSLP